MVSWSRSPLTVTAKQVLGEIMGFPVAWGRERFCLLSARNPCKVSWRAQWYGPTLPQSELSGEWQEAEESLKTMKWHHSPAQVSWMWFSSSPSFFQLPSFFHANLRMDMWISIPLRASWAFPTCGWASRHPVTARFSFGWISGPSFPHRLLFPRCWSKGCWQNMASGLLGCHLCLNHCLQKILVEPL